VAIAGALLFSRRRVLAGVLMAAGMLIPLAPVTVHNYAVSGEFIPLVWQGGLNFYLGNNATATGWSATSPEIRKDWYGGYADMIAIPRQALGRAPTFSEVSDFWEAKGLAFVRQQPLKWLRLLARKVGLFWNRMELPNNQDFNFIKTYSPVLRNPLIAFGTMAPLALVGLFAFRRHARRLYFLYGMLLASFAGTVAFFVCDRYRLPFVPPMLVLAGGVVGLLVATVRQRRPGASLAALASIAAAALIVNLNLTGVRPPDLAQSYTDMGKAYVGLGDYQQATGYFDRAMEVNPAWGEAYEQIGLVKMRQGDNAAATDYLLKAVRVWPDVAAPYRALAMIYLNEGNLPEARQAVDRALEISPFLEGAHNILGSIQRREGRPDLATASFIKETEINPSDWRAHANLGSTYDEAGDRARALEAFGKALALSPANPEVVLPLATLYAKNGDHQAARSLLDKLQPEAATDVNLKYNRAVILQQSGSSEEARSMYEEILRTNGLHEGALVNLGVIYARSGRTGEAQDLWLRALSVNPDNQTARRNLELLKSPE
jgi:Flp pilus assembly protein TadD